MRSTKSNNPTDIQRIRRDKLLHWARRFLLRTAWWSRRNRRCKPETMGVTAAMVTTQNRREIRSNQTTTQEIDWHRLMTKLCLLPTFWLSWERDHRGKGWKQTISDRRTWHQRIGRHLGTTKNHRSWQYRCHLKHFNHVARIWLSFQLLIMPAYPNSSRYTSWGFCHRLYVAWRSCCSWLQNAW